MTASGVRINFRQFADHMPGWLRAESSSLLILKPPGRRQRKRHGRSAPILPLSAYSAPGALRQDPGRAAESLAEARTRGNGGSDMRVLLSTWGSRGDIEPMLGFAVALRALGAEVRMCAPPDFADLLARVGVPLVPVGQSVRALVHGATPPSTADAPRVAADLVAAQFDTVAAAAEGCDALVATGLMPAGERTIAEKPGIRYVFACFIPPCSPVATPPAAGAAGPAVSTGRDPQPGAVGRGCRAGASTVRPAAQLLTGRRWAFHRWTTSATTSLTDQPWLAADPTRAPGWFAGPRRRADRRVGPAGRAPTPGRVGGVPGRLALRRCTWVSAACAPRRTPPGWPSRRSERRAVAYSSPAAGLTWP